FLRELPIKGAEMIAEMATKNKAVVAGYLLSVFIIMPGGILALTA
ncbi:MAG: Na/Pi cotransporter family protein, partial [Vibrio anguillarum]